VRRRDDQDRSAGVGRDLMREASLEAAIARSALTDPS
jgi:hypothetical protein